MSIIDLLSDPAAWAALFTLIALELVLGIDYTPWPWIAIGLGALAFFLGGFILATFRRWPGPTRKYQALGMAAAETPDSTERGSIADWDTLSEGGDPTEEIGKS